MTTLNLLPSRELLARRVSASTADQVQTAIRRFFAAQLVTILLLQKIAVNVGGGWLQLGLPILLFGLAYLAWHAALDVDLARTLCLAGFFAILLLSLALSGRPASPGALLILMILYLPICMSVPATRATYLWMARAYVSVTVICASVLFCEQAVNYTVGHRWWPNLEAFVPSTFLFPGFNYLQPMDWGSKLIKPNAVVFLEVSCLSQVIALGVVWEIVLFRRIWVLSVLAAALLLSFAGTGLMLLALLSPLLLPRIDRRILLTAAILLMACVPLAASGGWLTAFTHRADEFTRPSSSGYQRFTAPLHTTMQAVQDPRFLLSGMGPGNVPMAHENPLPISKLVTEYGLVAALSFYLLIGISLFHRARSMTMAAALLLFLSLGGGGLSVPLYVVLCMLLGTIAPREREETA